MHPSDSRKLFRVRATASVLRLQKTSASGEGSQRSAGRAFGRPESGPGRRTSAGRTSSGMPRLVWYVMIDPLRLQQVAVRAFFSTRRHKDVDEPEGWTTSFPCWTVVCWQVSQPAANKDCRGRRRTCTGDCQPPPPQLTASSPPHLL